MSAVSTQALKEASLQQTTALTPDSVVTRGRRGLTIEKVRCKIGDNTETDVRLTGELVNWRTGDGGSQVVEERRDVQLWWPSGSVDSYALVWVVTGPNPDRIHDGTWDRRMNRSRAYKNNTQTEMGLRRKCAYNA